MDIQSWLTTATSTLTKAGITSARLDALLLLSDQLQQNKAWVLAHPEHQLTPENTDRLNQNLARRTLREPLAYIRGHQEFYGRQFIVTPDVLIPRPETETLIEQLDTLQPKPNQKLLDIGTGSGAIAITAKLQFPQLQVHACDISPQALKIAETNAKKHHANITFIHQGLLHNDSNAYDIIIANLPYVSPQWQRSPETNHEPSLALFAQDNGQALIKQLLTQAPSHLATGGYLLLEADPEQHPHLIKFAQKHGFRLKTTEDYAIVLDKLPR